MKQTDLNAESLQLEVDIKSPTLTVAKVVIPKNIIATLYQQALACQQQYIQAPGFQRGNVPLDYVAENFKSSIYTHLKEFCLNYLVISFLYRELRNKKIVLSGEPRLLDISIDPQQHALFFFEIDTFPPIEIQEWKHLPFKAPKRKKYKDLDRQVDSFIKEELELFNKHISQAATLGDWINFNITLVDQDKKPLLGDYYENLWFRLSDEEADQPLGELFLGKKIGDRFYSCIKALQQFFSQHLDTNYCFAIEITDLLHSNYFCIDQFKRFFKIKTNKEMYQKLIEVFSYRNDLSQRRSMAEESLKLLLSKHRFELPTHLILRQQQKVLNAVQNNPDYHVYRMQKDFKKRVKQLAEKQAKEELLLDQIAYTENIAITNQDAKQYLNLIQRPRTKEFIYLAPPNTRLRGQEVPICAEELKHACLREKTLNHIIYHLTRA